MSSRAGERRTFCIPSSRPRRAAASSKRTSADIFGLNSDSRVDGVVASRIISGVSTIDYRTSGNKYFAGHDSSSRAEHRISRKGAKLAKKNHDLRLDHLAGRA